MKLCPCSPQKLFADCCEPFLLGQKQVATPVELMQSRFSAYAERKEQYVLQTWHPSSRPETVNMQQMPQWIGLQIVSKSSVGNRGTVEFKATYSTKEGIGVLHETSSFIRENNQWFYVDGKQHEQTPENVGRNEPCPCGSGLKFKKCCG